ncbi:sodium:solute symporter [Chloroflexota bacterium]
MNVVVWAIIGYIVIILSIGWITGRKGAVQGAREFFVAGADLRWFFIFPFVGGELASAWIAVGNAQMAYDTGIAVLMYFLGTPIAVFLVVFLLSKFLLRIRKVSLGEVFALLFDQKTRLAFVIVSLITSMFIMGGVALQLGTLVAPMLNIPYEAGALLSAVIIAGMALLGLRGVAWMNLAHFSVIITGFVIAGVASVNAVGGLGNLIALLPAKHLNPVAPGWATVMGWLIPTILGGLFSPITVMAMFASKSLRDARIGAIGGALVVFLLVFMPMAIGLSARVIFPDIESKFSLWVMGEHLGLSISVLISVATTACIISTTPGTLLARSAMATRDLFLLVKPDASDKTQLNFNTIFVPLYIIIGTLLVLGEGNLLLIIIKVAQVRLFFGVLVVVSVAWRRIHPTAAFWSLIGSFGVGVMWWIADSPFGISITWPTLAVGLLILVITSLIKRPSPFKGAEGLELQ